MLTHDCIFLSYILKFNFTNIVCYSFRGISFSFPQKVHRGVHRERNGKGLHMSSYTFNLPTDPKTSVAGLYSGAVNVVVTGRIEAQGVDQRMLLRFHTEPMGIRTGYTSIVRGNGVYSSDNIVAYTEWQQDPPATSSADNGIYLGRNGWTLDGEFMVDLTIAVNAPLDANFAQTTTDDTKLLVTGRSVFMLAGGKMLTHEIGGELAGLPNLTRDKTINRLTFDTGQAKGSWGTTVIRYY